MPVALTWREACRRAERRYWLRLLARFPGYGYRRLSRLAGVSQSSVFRRLKACGIEKAIAGLVAAGVGVAGLLLVGSLACYPLPTDPCAKARAWHWAPATSAGGDTVWVGYCAVYK